MSDLAPSKKECIICACDERDSFSKGQWSKKAGRARLCVDCMELDIEDDIPAEIDDRFEIFDVATPCGWAYDGPRPTRGEYTLARGASLSFSRTDPDGGDQHVYFWPSTGTTCSELLHPDAVEKTQLYRHSTAEHCKEMLHLVLRNPRQHTGVGYYWAEDGKFLGMGYDEVDEAMRAAGPRKSSGRGRRSGKAHIVSDGSNGSDDDSQPARDRRTRQSKSARPLEYFIDHKLDEECNLYKEGRCYYGIYCRRQHVGDVFLVPREKVDEICRNYQRGGCRYGDMCTRIHE